MENKSIFENDSLEKCYLCGKWGKVEEHHVFGGPSSVRDASDRYGLVVHICRDCHRRLHDVGGEEMLYLHQRGQMIYEERFGNRQAFIQEFIRSYL